jgi:hypothetical protein
VRSSGESRAMHQSHDEREGTLPRRSCVLAGLAGRVAACESAMPSRVNSWGTQSVGSEVVKKKEELPSNDRVSKCSARISPVPSRQGQFTWEQPLSPASTPHLSCICLPRRRRRLSLSPQPCRNPKPAKLHTQRPSSPVVK